ncbi:hypothetical protein LTR10_024329 [Elasticomyces elasticus]|uniref:Uncharacterized protein n=1 Tax=Exophiala sideris TaxID=1016849 RepID=A0ABR0IWE4_9EURO|nr:hypothetical protein LTR10_024329 [Elasticomyces elasticus]KAK5022706.1 hypothetical protein LTR13_011427 [Exophiala sideris]KAK5048475.1 hypothetical protein LTR69_011343 [Exophiala sideris]
MFLKQLDDALEKPDWREDAEEAAFQARKPRPSEDEGYLIQMKGNINAEACGKCKQHLGKFKICRSVGNIKRSACACCVWQFKETACSHALDSMNAEKKAREVQASTKNGLKRSRNLVGTTRNSPRKANSEVTTGTAKVGKPKAKAPAGGARAAAKPKSRVSNRELAGIDIPVDTPVKKKSVPVTTRSEESDNEEDDRSLTPVSDLDLDQYDPSE